MIARARGSIDEPCGARASGDVATPVTEAAQRWEYLVVTDAVGASLLGAASAPEEVAAVRRQIEALTSRAGFTHWWDPQLAKAWIARAVELTSDEVKAGLDARGSYVEQMEATRAAWRALSYAYRALNLPWMVDPVARSLYTSCTMGADSRQWCDTGTWGEAAQTFVPGPFVGTQDGGRACIQIHNRITLDTNSDVADFMTADEGDRDRWPRWGVTNIGGGVARLNTFDWHAFAWWDECAQRTGVKCERWRSHLFPPAIWSFNLAQDIARSLHARGPLRVLAESARCAFILNVKSAHDANVLSSVVGDTAATGLVGLAAVQVEEAATEHDERFDYVAGILTTAAGIALRFPGVGTVAAAFLGALAAATEVLGRIFDRIHPTQLDLDAWGRNRPVYEATYLTGSGTRDGAPTHRVPAPAAWVRPTSFPLLGYIPTLEVIEAVKRSEADHPPHAATPTATAPGVPGAVLVMGLVAILGIVALVTRDRWADDVRGG